MKSTEQFSGSVLAVLLCGALVVMAGNADAQVKRCVDADGKVLLTDATCPSGSAVVNADVSDGGEVGLVFNTGTTDTTGTERLEPQALSELKRSRWADLPRPLVRKQVGTDALTLQTARTTLQLRDSLRRQAHAVASR